MRYLTRIWFPERVADVLNFDPTFSDLFDSFYNTYLKKRNNDGIGPKESLKIAAIINSAYETARLVDVGF